MKALLARSRHGLFASATVTGHLVRGAVAFLLLGLAIRQQHAQPALAVLAGLGALVAMRGCPVCWAIGLVETVSQRMAQRPSASRDYHSG